MGELRGTEQITSAKQNQNIREALTGASSILNIWRENRAIVLKSKQEMAIYSLLQRRDVMEILSTRFGKSMIFTVLAMAKEEISSSKNLYDHNSSSKKYYRRPDIWNVVAHLYSNGPYDRNSKFQCFEKAHLHLLYYSVLENNTLQRNTSNGVRDCGRWIVYSRRKTHNLILHTFLLGVA